MADNQLAKQLGIPLGNSPQSEDSEDVYKGSALAKQLGIPLTNPKPSLLSSGLGAGFRSIESAAGGLASGVGALTGSKGLQGYGKGLTQSANKALAKDAKAAPQSFSNVHGVGDFGKYAAYKVLQGIPEIAGIIAGSAVGAAALPEIAGSTAVGSIVGGAAADLPVAYGSSYNELSQQPGITPKQAAEGAAVEALPQAALATAVPEVAFGGKLLGKEAGGLLSRLGKNALIGSGVAAGAGEGSVLLNNATAHTINPNIKQGPSNPEVRKQMVDALAAGLPMGAVLGLAGGIKAPKIDESAGLTNEKPVTKHVTENQTPPEPVKVIKEDLQGTNLPPHLEGADFAKLNKTIDSLNERLTKEKTKPLKATKKAAGITIPDEFKGKTAAEIDAQLNSGKLTEDQAYLGRTVRDHLLAKQTETVGKSDVAKQLEQLQELRAKLSEKQDFALSREAPQQATTQPEPIAPFSDANQGRLDLQQPRGQGNLFGRELTPTEPRGGLPFNPDENLGYGRTNPNQASLGLQQPHANSLDFTAARLAGNEPRAALPPPENDSVIVNTPDGRSIRVPRAQADALRNAQLDKARQEGAATVANNRAESNALVSHATPRSELLYEGLTPDEQAKVDHYSAAFNTIEAQGGIMDPRTGKMYPQYVQFLLDQAKQAEDNPNLNPKEKAAIQEKIGQRLIRSKQEVGNNAAQEGPQPTGNQRQYQETNGRGQTAESGNRNRTERSAPKQKAPQKPAEEVIRTTESDSPNTQSVPFDVQNYTKMRDAFKDDPNPDIARLTEQSTRTIEGLIASKERMPEFAEQYNIAHEQLAEAQRYVDTAKLELGARESDPELAKAASKAEDARLAQVDKTAAESRPTKPQTDTISPEDLADPAKRNQWLEDHQDSVDDVIGDLYFSRKGVFKDNKEAHQQIDYDKETLDTIRKIAGVDVAKRARVGTHREAGSYDPTTSIISVALNQADPTSTAAHEAFHWVQTKALTDNELSVLNHAFNKDTRIARDLKARIQQESNAEELLKEIKNPKEAQAYAFQYWRKGELDARGTIAKIFNKIRQVFDRVKNYIDGRGYKSWDDVFNAANAGQYASRIEENPYIPKTKPVLLEPDLFEMYAVKDSGLTGELADLWRSKVKTFPEGSSMKGSEEILNNAHQIIPERDWRRFIPSIPNSDTLDSTSTHMKRAWASTVGTMYNIGRNSSQFRKFYGLVQDRNNFSATIQAKADSLVHSLIKESSPQRIQKIGNVLFQTTAEKLGTIKPYELARYDIHDPKLDAMGMPSDSELKARGLDDKAIQEYKDVRHALNETIRQRAEAEAQKYRDSKEPERSRSILDDAKRSIAEGYMPQRRFGSHAVVVREYTEVKGKDGKIKKEPVRDTNGTKYFASFGSQHAAEFAAKTLQEALGDPLEKSKLRVDYRQLDKSMLHENGRNVQSMLDLLDSLDINLPEDKRAKIIKHLTQADADARRRLLSRKNIPGYSRDMLRTMADFFASEARRTAKAVYSKPIEEAIASGDWENDGPLGGFYKQKATELVNDLNMVGITPDTYASKLRTAASMLYLGGSPAAALVQLTQIPLGTVPFMSQFENIPRVYSTTLKAFRDSIGPKAGDVEGLRAAVAKGEGFHHYSADEAAATLKASDQGKLYPAEIYTMMGISQGKLLARSSGARKAIDTWMKPFTYSEQVNRRTTFLAAYRQAQRLLQSKPEMFGEGKSYQDAFDYASRAVDETQGIYDKTNRPHWARSGWGGALYTFKMFPTMMVELLAGMNGRGRATMLGSMALVSGVQGLPFVQDGQNALDAIGRWLGIESLSNTQKTTRETLAHIEDRIGVSHDWTNYVLNGVADATGLNLSRRLGLGSIVPGMQGLADNDFGEVLKGLAGPAASAPQSALKAIPDALHGDVLGFLKTQPSVALKNIAKSYEALHSGRETNAYGYNSGPVNAYQAIMQGVGFSPAIVSRNYAASSNLKRTENFKAQVEQDFKQNIVEAEANHDYQQVNEIYQSIEQWNKTHSPWENIRITPQSLRSKSQSVNATGLGRAVNKIPRRNRAGVETMLKREGF